ncbi:DUF6376 family protein [Paenibacillus tarimensis]
MIVRVLLVALISGLLTGCSWLGEVNNSLDYVKEATSFINKVNSFAEQVPTLAEQAVTDPQAVKMLTNEMEMMKNNIASFNGLDAPAFARDVHEELVGYNKTLLAEIDAFLATISNGTLTLDTLADSQINQTIAKIGQTLTAIQQLGG